MEEQTEKQAGSDMICVANPPDKVPAFLKPFVGKTAAQFLGKFFPQKTIEAMGGFISGIAPNFGVDVPEWARESSKQFWKYYGFSKNFDASESVRDFGVFAGLVEHFVRNPQPEPKSLVDKFLTKAAPKFIKFLTEKAIADLSALQKSEYYAGQHRASEIISKMETPTYLDMVKLAPLYLVVSVAWKKIQSFDTHYEREKWLRTEKVIKENVTSREVYQAFDVIGLPGAKPGRPKHPES
jgi:hypothetical protein